MDSIPFKLGFVYPSNFSVMFKRATGKSPNEWGEGEAKL
ncbi:MAG: hypothetical protein KHZ79_03470 [Atopobium minutum]|nr:hypothetical protein [Atopobium minutum]